MPSRRRQPAHARTSSRSRRSPSMDRRTGKPLVPPPVTPEKTTIVLDLDETLVYARDGPVHRRPQLHNLVAVLGIVFEAVVWTAGSREYAQAVVEEIDPNGVIQHCVYRHPKWFPSEDDYTKDLTLLGRDLSKVLIVENTPECVRKNPNNAIIVPDYTGPPQRDGALATLTEVLRGLSKSKLTVPQYLESCPLLTRKPIEVADGTIMAYTISGDPVSPVRKGSASTRSAFDEVNKSPLGVAQAFRQLGALLSVRPSSFPKTPQSPLEIVAFLLALVWVVLRVLARFAAVSPFRKLASVRVLATPAAVAVA